MGRKKVDPSRRQRALHACQPCHASKKRCDCKQPCSNCIKRNATAMCVYSSSLPRLPGVARQEKSAPPNEDNISESAPDCPTSRSIVLWSSRGNQVYVGDAASLSFLHLLRDILSRYMGPSAFTDDARKIYMLEAARNTLNGRSVECQHTFEDSCDLADYFLAVTSGVLDVFSRETIREKLRTRLDEGSEALDNAVMNAIIAIGAQTRLNGQQDLRCESIHLAQAQQTAFEGMLEDPSINLVRVFLLLGFYMLGACRRNSAYIYIGIAARASCALGLHHEESYRGINEQESRSRLKTWRSVRTLDLLVGSVLGRPVGTSVITRGSGIKNEKIDVVTGYRTFSATASSQVWRLADEAVHKFYEEKCADISVAKEFLTRLEEWSSSLPSELRSYNPTGSRVQDQELVIGNAHVACSYYFTVILVTRKFLITDLMKDIGNRIDGIAENKTAASEKSELSKLTNACTEAAQLMLQTCRDLLDANLLLKNMPLMKAWIFSAGLILGFAMFASSQNTRIFGRAFGSATDVLHMLSQQSPIAQLYYEILSNFRQAIQQHHERKLDTSSSSQNSYVEKIFSLNGSINNQDPNESPETDLTLGSPIQAPGGFEDAFSFGIDGLSPSNAFEPNFGSAIGEFDSIAAQLWDDFIFNQDFGNNALA